MRIIFSILILVLVSNVVVLSAFSEDVLEEEVSKEELFKQMQERYSRKVRKTGFMQKKVLEYNEKKFGVDSIETLKSLEALAWMRMEQQDFKGAEIFYQRVIKIRKELLPQSEENVKELATVYFMIGDSFLYRSRYARAIANYDESMSYAIDHGHRGDTLSRKGIAGEGLKDHQRALDFYLEALKEYDTAKTLNPENTKLVDKRVLIIYKRLPELYHKLGENVKVKEYQDLIKDIKAQKREERKAEKGRI